MKRPPWWASRWSSTVVVDYKMAAVLGAVHFLYVVLEASSNRQPFKLGC